MATASSARPRANGWSCSASSAVAAMIDLIRADLALLGIHHDLFASEAEVQASGRSRPRADATLRDKGLVYEGMLEAPKGETPRIGSRSSCTLFRSTQFGDDQDRPIRKSDGSWTYFGVDTAYHLQKAEQADELIDIWGADHAGTVKRIQAAVDGADRRARRARRQDRPDGAAAARRRAGQDVEAARQLRHPRRRGRRGRQGRGRASPC